MAFFNKGDAEKVDRSGTTIIATGTKVTGNFDLECKLHVDGHVTGQVRSSSLITIGKQGLVEGEILAKKLVVTGRFAGTATCEEVEILGGGKVTGRLMTRILVIERGSLFEGESRPMEPQKGGAEGVTNLLMAPSSGNSPDLPQLPSPNGQNLLT
ncbi:MAG: polymer-forming cytoskeletal protein [Magnetococcales bacterium]|nr:polymer-forming cytoskeletal protein [Magnetococcales bacterium]